jgi:hypothetical protein
VGLEPDGRGLGELQRRASAASFSGELRWRRWRFGTQAVPAAMLAAQGWI